MRPASGYRSAFRAWDRQAWVRARPHRDEPFESGLAYFTPELVPLLAVPGARDALPAEVAYELGVHHLHWHLRMTVQLEMGPVNDACRLLVDPSRTPGLPATLRHDALRVYTDEGGHAEMTYGLSLAAARATGVEPLTVPPPYVRRVASLVDRADPGLADHVRLLAAVVSETLVSATLTLVPEDERVQASVREVIADHAADEHRHAVFFRDVFARFWPSLDAPVRRRLGLLLPDLVNTFFEPDRVVIEAVASCYPDVFPDPAEAAEAAVGAPKVRTVPVAAENTLRLFAAYGVLDDPEVAAAFEKAGLSAAA